MRTLSIQVQPLRSSTIDMNKVVREFELIASMNLATKHGFDSGEDDGPYFNFVFETVDAEALWSAIKEKLYGPDQLGHWMKESSMAMCSSDDSWDDYDLLFHCDPEVEIDSPSLGRAQDGR